MLKVIPVEEAVGLPLAHDITKIVPGKHKGPAFRRGHIVRQEDISKLLDVGKRNLYVMELEKDELHEEDAARTGASRRRSEPNAERSERRANQSRRGYCRAAQGRRGVALSLQ